jgi:hypothetical protein
MADYTGKSIEELNKLLEEKIEENRDLEDMKDDPEIAELISENNTEIDKINQILVMDEKPEGVSDTAVQEQEETEVSDEDDDLDDIIDDVKSRDEVSEDLYKEDDIVEEEKEVKVEDLPKETEPASQISDETFDFSSIVKGMEFEKGGKTSRFWEKTKELGRKGYKKSKELAREANERRKEQLHNQRKKQGVRVASETAGVIIDKLEKDFDKVIDGRDAIIEHYNYPEGYEQKIKIEQSGLRPAGYKKGGSVSTIKTEYIKFLKDNDVDVDKLKFRHIKSGPYGDEVWTYRKRGGEGFVITRDDFEIFKNKPKDFIYGYQLPTTYAKGGVVSVHDALPILLLLGINLIEIMCFKEVLMMVLLI